MLELPNLGQMTTSTIQFDKILLVKSWAETAASETLLKIPLL